MLRRRVLTAALSAGVLTGVVALAACSDRGNVPTLNQDGRAVAPRTQAEEIADQARGAEELLDCLAAAEIPAATESWYGDGQLHVVIDVKNDYILSWGQMPEFSEPLSDALLAMAEKYDPHAAMIREISAGGSPPAVEDVEVAPYLIIGARDHTEDLRQCLQSSGYTEPIDYPDPADEIAAKQATLSATLSWIECARANGYPNMEDPEPVQADDWQTEPRAVLPATITEGAMRALVEACPIVDEQAWVAHYQALIDLGQAPSAEQFREVEIQYPLNQPNIGFDVPGADGRYRPGARTGDPFPDSVVRAFQVIQAEDDRLHEKYADMFAGG
ncbi:MAG: hypothetical protein LBC97_06810 [Bifidobacteriaceae bacterium]|jgi:hypothetical protein|nr:hypothetical protein [Bifidobacteriaceae bacterium]